MNIVIPFRNTCGTDELDMCIKLIKKNLKINYDNIYIIGDEVNQFKDSVINIVVNEQKYNKWLDSNFLIKTYIETIRNPFILFNDDFFLTENVDNIPCYYFDTLQKHSGLSYCHRKQNYYLIMILNNCLLESFYLYSDTVFHN